MPGVVDQPPHLTGSPGLDPGQESQGVGGAGPAEGVGGVLVTQTSHYGDLGPVYQGRQTGVLRPGTLAQQIDGLQSENNK